MSVPEEVAPRASGNGSGVPTSPACSVIVCSFNRMDALRRFLDHLAESTSGIELEWELVVVDNASTDDTPAVVEEFAERLPVRYLLEPRQGKSHALNRGIRNAAAKILVFTDDDALPAPDWLTQVTREFAEDPELGMLGGRVELHDERDIPKSIRTSRDRKVAESAWESLAMAIGCNLAMRRGVFEAIGGFEPELGPGSPRSLVGEDCEYVYRAWRRGFKVVYSPDVLVHHDHGRRGEEDRIALDRVYARGRGAIYARYSLLNDRDIQRTAYWEMRWFFGRLLGRRTPREERLRAARGIKDMLLGATAMGLILLGRRLGVRDSV